MRVVNIIGGLGFQDQFVFLMMRALFFQDSKSLKISGQNLEVALIHGSHRIRTQNFLLFLNPGLNMGIPIWKIKVDLQITLKMTFKVKFKVTIRQLAVTPATFIRIIFPKNEWIMRWGKIRYFLMTRYKLRNIILCRVVFMLRYLEVVLIFF